MRQSFKNRQRGYAAIPYITSFFSATGAAAGGATAAGAAAGSTAAAAGGAAAASGAVAAGAAGGAAAATGAGLGSSLVSTVANGALALGVSKLLAPKMPNLPSGAPPTIDEAKQAQQTSDRLRRRTGVLANIYSSGTGGATSVGQAKLLGG